MSRIVLWCSMCSDDSAVNWWAALCSDVLFALQVSRHLGRWEIKYYTLLWQEAPLEVKSVNTPGVPSSLEVEMLKKCTLLQHCCGAKHIWKWKCTKHIGNWAALCSDVPCALINDSAVNWWAALCSDVPFALMRLSETVPPCALIQSRATQPVRLV